MGSCVSSFEAAPQLVHGISACTASTLIPHTLETDPATAETRFFAGSHPTLEAPSFA